MRHAMMLGVRVKAIRLRDQTSRWGSCSTSGTLSFSWRLIMAPPFVLDYLAAHEVAHLHEMNHSPRFWHLVESVWPANPGSTRLAQPGKCPPPRHRRVGRAGRQTGARQRRQTRAPCRDDNAGAVSSDHRACPTRRPPSPTSRGRGRLPQAGRRCCACRRTRRRQDHLRPCPHPGPRRRCRARSAEPDLHPRPGLWRRPACRSPISTSTDFPRRMSSTRSASTMPSTKAPPWLSGRSGRSVACRRRASPSLSRWPAAAAPRPSKLAATGRRGPRP